MTASMQIMYLPVEKININNSSVSRLYVGPDGFSFLVSISFYQENYYIAIY